MKNAVNKGKKTLRSNLKSLIFHSKYSTATT